MTSLRLALIALLAVLTWTAAADAATLSATRHGPVDLGDRVGYRVEGAGCARAGVAVRLLVGPRGREVRGPRSTPLPSPEGGCAGIAHVPDFAALRSAGWEAGDRIDVALVSGAGTVPLRHTRMEADLGEPVAGSPDVVPADDEDTPDSDRAVALDPGDAVSLGRVDLRRADGLALRLCVAGEDSRALPDLGQVFAPDRLEAPQYLTVRQGGPDGPVLLGPVDVSASMPQEISRLSLLGFPGCYRLVVLPITGRVVEDAPELVVRAEQPGRSGALRLNSVDVTGTGAKLPPLPPPAPAGMRTIFDGTSFDGWDHAACALRDGAAVNERTADDTRIDGCSLTWREPLRDVVLRFRMRREHLLDNAGIYLGPAQEIQLRSVGEYLPGGFFGQFAARWQKLNSFPAYDEIEVVQLGARHVVSVNGRTVTDVLRAAGPPEPYRLQVVSQPIWSYRVGAEATFGNEGAPDLVKPADWGAFWFDEVRLLRCDGPDDPVCRRLADARRGQVPVPQGAPAPLPAEEAAGCAKRRRAVTVTLPRGRALTALRASVAGRRARVRRLTARRVRVTLPAAVTGRVTVRVTGRRGGRAVSVSRRVPACERIAA